MREFYKKIGDEHVMVLVTPLFHMFSIDMLFSAVLHKGNTAIIMPKPNLDAVLHSIQRYEATLFAGVPTLYRMILEHDRLDMYDLSSLRICWSAGDVLPKEVYNRWKERFGIPLHQVYGSTETVCISVTDVSTEPKTGSVGPPIPGRYVMLVDPDTLEPVKSGDPGELLVSADFPTPGYWGRDEETAETYVKLNGRTWCRTGDYVVLEEGEIYFVDRRKDIIKYKGYRIAAAEVEAVLQDHPAVIVASVVGVKDERVGERVKAFVVLKEDARGVTAQELIRWCRERLASYKVPEYIEFRDFLPKSKVGKVLRRELRDEERRRVGAG
jgi:long-chain acyl-CoA synthetase